MDAEEYQAAGLYDPDAPDAPDRLKLLEHLAGSGISLEDMLAAQARGSLHAAVSDRAIRPGRVMSVHEVATEVGIPAEMLRKVTLAAGIPLADHDYRESDIETFALFAGGADIFGEDATLQFTRAVGSSMARVADAAIALFIVEVEGPLMQEGAGQTPLAEAAEQATTALAGVPAVMGGLFRLHVEAAIRRQRVASRQGNEPGAFQLAVGFVDMAGFTPFAEDASPSELAQLIEEFEARANEVVAECGGRVVKHVGDEVMFVEADPVIACEIALELVEGFGDAAVAPHAGVGYGLLIARGGDYYGSVVNLASRIADLAVPGEVLVTEALQIAASTSAVPGAPFEFEFEPAGRRLLKGVAEPVPLASVRRPRPVS